MLITTIQKDLLTERKNGSNKIAISLLTTLYSEAANIGINDGKRQTTDAEVSAVIKKFIKGIDECLTHSPSNEQYLAEKTILEKYLPKQLSESELQFTIKIFVETNTGAKKADVMKHLKALYAGQYDGKMAADITDKILGA